MHTIALRTSPFSRHLHAALLAIGLGFASHSHAAQLADVHLTDRHSGQRLPIYQHRGEYWVAGRPGASYAVDVSNRSSGRILAVLSVDGVNAITGRAASATPDDGYVLGPWQHSAITGWRKSDRQVAAFYFSDSDASYASRTGRPRDVGVIGVALFRERLPEPAPPVLRRSPAQEERAEAAAADSAAANKSASPRTPSLGTGHGAMEPSHTRTVDFASASQRPAQTVRIRYDSYANLVAKGVIRVPRTEPERSPNPFPASGYVPDPPP